VLQRQVVHRLRGQLHPHYSIAQSPRRKFCEEKHGSSADHFLFITNSVITKLHEPRRSHIIMIRPALPSCGRSAGSRRCGPERGPLGSLRTHARCSLWCPPPDTNGKTFSVTSHDAQAIDKLQAIDKTGSIRSSDRSKIGKVKCGGEVARPKKCGEQ
jgi:hypothetical protein